VAAQVLDNVIITTQAYEDLKKKLLQRFLDHLDGWPTEALGRVTTIVTSKSEELTSELDLKFHLKEPRFKQADVDVHHTRATDFVLPLQRVTRHSKGVANTLAEVKVQLSEIT